MVTPTTIPGVVKRVNLFNVPTVATLTGTWAERRRSLVAELKSGDFCTVCKNNKCHHHKSCVAIALLFRIHPSSVTDHMNNEGHPSVSSTMRITKFITVLNQKVMVPQGWNARPPCQRTVSNLLPELWVTNWRKRGKTPEGRKDYIPSVKGFLAR